MKFKYFNYFLPILVLHILALFGHVMTVSENQYSYGHKVISVLKAQIQSSLPSLTQSKPKIKENISPKNPTPDHKTSSEAKNLASQTNTNGPQEADIKNQYFADLKAHIEQHKHYPMMSRRLGQTGKVIVAFTLHRDGSFTNIHLHESCPFERLNVAALDAVKNVGKFRPIPKEINSGFLDIQVPIEYQSIN